MEEVKCLDIVVSKMRKGGCSNGVLLWRLQEEEGINSMALRVLDPTG
jgi:hypothetical protein